MSLTGKPELTTASPITNDGFWVDVSMADLMNKYRIPSDIPNDTIKWGLSLAVVRVNEKLNRVKEEILLTEATFEAYIAANPQPVVASERLKVNYEHAVFSRAKAFLLQQFGMMSRKNTDGDASELEQSEQFWLDESASAIASLMTTFFPLESFSANDGVHVALI